MITKRDEPPVGYENESNQSGNSGKSQESYVLPSSPRSSVDTINEGVHKITLSGKHTFNKCG